MKQIFIIVFMVSVLSCKAQDTIKVLFIGNSFTSQNNLPALFSQLSQGSGKNVVIASHMPGGISVGDISQGTSAHMNNPLVYSLIRSNNWDYLVLQDNQGRFCLGYGLFPSSSLVIGGHLKIRDSLLFYHPCAHMIWFAGFGPKNGYPPYGNTGEALIDSIYQNYQFLNDTALQIIAPIGPAFIKIISGYPSIDLWGPDETHPSLYGSFLTACVIYSTIYKSSSVKSLYNPGISSTEDSLLKNIAFQTTMDSINSSGLAEITPAINQTGDTLSITGYQNCNWFYNDSSYASNNGVAIIYQPGDYYAVITDSNGCEFRTAEHTYSLTGIAENSVICQFDITIYPNPAQDKINIEAPQESEIQVLNIEGQIIKKIHSISNVTTISLRDFSSGVYIIKAKSDNGIVTKKFIIE